MESSASSMSYNVIFNKIQSAIPNYIENRNYNMLQEIFDCKFSDCTKCYVEAAFRDFNLRKICVGGKVDLEHIKAVVNISIEGASKDLCLPTLPVFILSDTFDCITIQQCEELFEFVEGKVATWKEPLFFIQCKNQVLRMCNDVLRRLSRSQNTIFCGRILLFLARFFPFSERSGLNLISEFNLENITVFTDTEMLMMEVGEDLEINEKPRPSLDYTLYTKFWALQDFFRNPVQCYQKSPWKLFTKYADDILEAFQSFKLDYVQASKSADANSKPKEETQASRDEDDQYFPKYLTNQKLLDLQFSDSNFRRYILVQMLILGQYLTSNIKFKQETLTEGQLMWVRKMQESCYSLLAETPSNGREFVDIVKAISKREEVWNDWKNNGCPEVRKPGTSLKRRASEAWPNGKGEGAESESSRKKEKRKLGDLIKEADCKKKYTMGNPEMTRLWNILPNNMEACLQNSRDFVPSLESFFAQAIDQVLERTKVKDEQKLVNDSNFGWRGLRLLAGKSSHFFTNSGNSIATLPEYLTNMIAKVAKDLPSQVNEEVKEEEEDKDEEIGMLEQGEGVKEEVEEDEEEDENTQRNDTPLVEQDKKWIAAAFADEGDAWKKLGAKLGFGTDELDYFETNEEKTETMIDRWIENDKVDATRESLLYYLEALKLESVTKKLFPSA